VRCETHLLDILRAVMDDQSDPPSGPRGLPPNAWLPADEPVPAPQPAGFLPPTGGEIPVRKPAPQRFAPPLPEGPPQVAGMPLASWGYRMGAGLIDFALVVLLAIGMVWLLGSILQWTGWDPGWTLNDTSFDWFATTVVVGAFVICWVMVKSVVAIALQGASLGKWVAGTAVVDERTGAPVSFGSSLMRELLCMIPGLLCGIFWLADALVPAGAGRRSLRDQMSSTSVVQRPAYAARKTALSLLAVGALAVIVGAAVWVASVDDGTTDGTPQTRLASAEPIDDPPPAPTKPLPGWTQADLAQARKDCVAHPGTGHSTSCRCVVRYITGRITAQHWFTATKLTRRDREVIETAWAQCE
jgi:uncharacterized RDD family membrane protein YckC